MIVDALSRAMRYELLHPNLGRAFAFLRTAPADLADGRHPIASDDIYANVMSYETKLAVDAAHEVHRQYADVQFIVSGTEAIRFTPGERLGRGDGYQEEKDFELHRSPADPSTLLLNAGQFAVFFPGEGHKPGVAWPVPAVVKKIVVKVRLA